MGPDTTRFKPGDQVYGLTGFGLGAYAEYKCMKETDSTHGCLALKPANLTYEEATVAAYGGLLALQYTEKGNIQPGQRGAHLRGVRDIGYDGGAVCEAPGGGGHRGMQHSEPGTGEVPRGRAVIDYTKEDTPGPGATYDFALDAVGKARRQG